MMPIRCYLVCAVQRTGSGLLTETLKSTAVAGVPEEYFLSFEEGDWARKHGVPTRQAFLDLVFAKGTGPNGVFGAKLMWNTFQDPFQTKLREMPVYAELSDVELLNTFFNQPKFIWNTRRDKVRQAVSWAIAAQTDIWASHQSEPHQGEPEKLPVFDFEFIDNLHRLAIEWEASWADFFKRAGLQPFKVVYEDFLEDFAATAVSLFDYLEIRLPAGFRLEKPTTIKQQATARNNKWAARYIEMKYDRDSLRPEL
ncbi:MAG TPA: Stf0 family sulfotransferase [Chloroflexota bacterium]|nr:Stf0 family sulfotransferase [Chloroflexota bacterium]HUM70395.1 Stf0 family sulfotransferase [Chloroflexota bacterium]